MEACQVPARSPYSLTDLLSDYAPPLMSQSNEANATGGAARGRLTRANITHLK